MISDVYFPRINGVSTSIRTFRRNLEDLGHVCDVIAPEYPLPFDSDPGIYRIPSRYIFFDPEDRLMRRRPIRDLEDTLKDRNYDLVHIQTPFIAHYAGLELAGRLELPCLTTYHTYFEEYMHHYAPWLPKRMLRFASRRASSNQCNEVDAVVVPSRAIYELLRGYGVNGNMHIIPTGIDLGEFERGDGDAFRARYGIAAERPLLCHVGRAAIEKNIDFLIRMLVHVRDTVPDILLVIAGEGPARRDLERQVHELGLTDNVLFVGYLARDGALLDCYRAATAFVFASRTETQGLVLLEAMALGIPVISTAVMGTEDVLRDGEGALIVEENETAFAEKVLRLLGDSDLQEELRDTGRAYVQAWTAEAKTRQLVELYEQVLSVSPSRAATPN